VQGVGSPVHAVPGLTPKSPVITDRPVLVTVVAASTAKVEAVPRVGAVVTAKTGRDMANTNATIAIVNTSRLVRRGRFSRELFFSLCIKAVYPGPGYLK